MVSEWLRALRDLVLAPACLLCGDEPIADLGLGAACRARLELLDPRAPSCARCGRPNPVPYDGGVCADCASRPPPFACAASAARYGGAAREALLAFKLRHDVAAGWLLDELLDRAVDALGVEGRVAGAVVPVPSHPSRRRERGFAPVSELARSLANRKGLPMRKGWLVRVRAGAPQGVSATRSRRENVRDAFGFGGRCGLVAPRSPRGIGILLVDDVFTSGSTARECARALRGAGAREVRVVTVARGGLGPGAVLDAGRERARSGSLKERETGEGCLEA